MTARQKMLAEIARLQAENAAMRRAQGVAQPAVQYSRKAGPKAPKPVTPDWIIKRAIDSDLNKALAAALRARGLEASGEPWAEAKRQWKLYVDSGFTVNGSLTMGHIADLTATMLKA